MESPAAPERIEVIEGVELVITWDDGTVASLDAAGLRAACQCASCREEAGLQQTALVLAGPVPVTITDAQLVGGYAVSFVFAPDGHGTGIYPYEALYALGRAAGGGEPAGG
jgi:DUF971 family protein